ncbi:MAG: PIN domain-containing protein [Halobacteriota archaeon]
MKQREGMKLRDFDAVTKLFENLRVDILPIEYMCKELVEFITKYSLLPNDAIYVATMKGHGITNIATNDPDFERVGWLKVWKP